PACFCPPPRVVRAGHRSGSGGGGAGVWAQRVPRRPEPRGAQETDAVSSHRPASRWRVLWLLSCTRKKVTRSSRSRSESLCLGSCRSAGTSSRSGTRAFTPLRGASCFSLPVQRKVSQEKHGRTRPALRREHPEQQPRATATATAKRLSPAPQYHR